MYKHMINLKKIYYIIIVTKKNDLKDMEIKKMEELLENQKEL